MTEPMKPTTTDSSTTDQSTCRREAPSVRRVASSRSRWATVIASVFAITKLPTNSATPPKPSRKYLMKSSPCCVSLESALACSAADLTWVVSESSGRICPSSSGVVTPSSALTRIRSSLPRLSNSRLCGRQVEDRDRGAAERVDGAEPDDAGDLVLPDRAVRERARRSGRPRSSCFSAVDLSIAIWRSPLGQLPLTSWSGLRLWSASRVDGERDPVVGSADRLAVRRRRAAPRPRSSPGRGDARQSLDLAQDGRVEGGASAVSSAVLVASFELMTASVSAYDSS